MPSGKKPQVLFVDDDANILEMLQRMLRQQASPWEAHFCASADAALAVLEAIEIDTIVSDIKMPGKDGFEFLGELRESEQTRRIPVVILTGDCDTALKRKALDLGATDLLNKPIHREDLLARIRNALRLKSFEDRLEGRINLLDEQVRERTEQLEAAHREIVWCLAKACEYRDDETGNHVARVACYSRLLAEKLGCERDFLDLIFLTSPLHDIGKIGIPDSILLKKGKLTPEERKIIERHTFIGNEILSRSPKALLKCGISGIEHLLSSSKSIQQPLLKMACSIAKSHHERWDGGGYPAGLSGNDIPPRGPHCGGCGRVRRATFGTAVQAGIP